MLGTHYKKSPLIFGERKWAGRRAPGGPLPEPTIISFGASAQILRELEQAMIQLNSDRETASDRELQDRGQLTRYGANGRPDPTWSRSCGLTGM